MRCVPFQIALFSIDNKKEANLTFNAFTPDHNLTIIQISNLIFLLTQTFYILPKFSSVFKFHLGETFVSKYVAPFKLSAIFQDIVFDFIIQQPTDDCSSLIGFAVFVVFALWALAMTVLSIDNFCFLSEKYLYFIPTMLPTFSVFFLNAIDSAQQTKDVFYTYKNATIKHL